MRIEIRELRHLHAIQEHRVGLRDDSNLELIPLTHLVGADHVAKLIRLSMYSAGPMHRRAVEPKFVGVLRSLARV